MDLYNNVKIVGAVEPQVASSTVTGTAIDCANAGGVMVVAAVGSAGITLTDTDKITVGLTECDTVSGGYTAVDAGNLAGGVVVLGSGGVTPANVKIGYRGNKRYIKPVFTFAGTHSGGTAVNAVVVLGGMAITPGD